MNQDALKRALLAISAISYAALAIEADELEHAGRVQQARSRVSFQRRHVERNRRVLSIEQWLYRLRRHEEKCYDFTRLRPADFDYLLGLLTTAATPRLKSTRGSLSAAAKLAITLNMCATGKHYRAVRERFEIDLATISRLFNSTLNSLTWLHGQFVKQPARHTGPHPKVAIGTRGEAFCDAVGALDGSHFHSFISQKDQKPFRNRKGTLTQNVLSAVDFDGDFVFVLAGWEGSAHDGRVLNAAVEKHGFMKDLPHGKYYLADAGYLQSTRLFVPFCGVRYHLKEWKKGAEAPQTARELYNHRHSGLRIVVERVFGIFKRRFQVFSSATGPQFPFPTQIKLVYALTGLHNLINRRCGLGYEFVDSQDLEDAGNHVLPPIQQNAVKNSTRLRAASDRRLRLAAEMFIEYAPRHGISVPAEVHVMRRQGRR